MAHLAGINKGQFWTGQMTMVCWNASGNGRRRWKFYSEVHFNAAGNGVKCNYVIYWSRETGMELVDKWETEGKITNANRNNISRYFELFEEHISPKSNALIAIVELKRLFQVP